MSEPSGADIKTFKTIYSKRSKKKLRNHSNVPVEHSVNILSKTVKTTKFKALSKLNTLTSTNLGISKELEAETSSKKFFPKKVWRKYLKKVAGTGADNQTPTHSVEVEVAVKVEIHQKPTAVERENVCRNTNESQEKINKIIEIQDKEDETGEQYYSSVDSEEGSIKDVSMEKDTDELQQKSVENTDDPNRDIDNANSNENDNEGIQQDTRPSTKETAQSISNRDGKEDHERVLKNIREEKIAHHTYTSRDDKSHAFVIRRLADGTISQNIEED
ncbi:unnamed protein product [Psylliodes chrysocephalus]|uniref:Uncharacterized protein n=1 Tax=Psylliodes chrysocephalus TaxID=3402493 RepID=A0A9P0CHY2_9CUCU|nr:unnamed protein product [Psylliodes chrysocephala]